MNELTAARIAAAEVLIRPDVEVTPLLWSPVLSSRLGCSVHLKCEHMHSVGSFKQRGALHKIKRLLSIERHEEVITASTGNHGQAVAHVCRQEGILARVFVPDSTSRIKIDGIRAFGGVVHLLPGDAVTVEVAARQTALDRKISFIAPYNDIDVILGQATVATEILRQLPDVDAVFLSVGGGGLASGVGSALKTLSSRTQLWGCWPEVSKGLYDSLSAGKIVASPDRHTVAEGAGGNIEHDSMTFEICQRVLTGKTFASEAEIESAMRLLIESDRQLVEGAAALALAGLEKERERFRGAKVVVVLCGRNLDPFSLLGIPG